jgi:hypothetical protein
MLNAEPDTTSDILSENGSDHTSIVLRPRQTGGGDVRACTVTVLEERSNSLFVL